MTAPELWHAVKIGAVMAVLASIIAQLWGAHSAPILLGAYVGFIIGRRTT